MATKNLFSAVFDLVVRPSKSLSRIVATDTARVDICRKRDFVVRCGTARADI